MMKKLMIMNLIFTPMLNHPISLGSMMMTQTTLMCLISSSISKSSWISYIMFITVIGGLMVMFMYMSSICSNEKFKSVTNKKLILLMILMTLLTLILTKEKEILINMNTMEMSKISMTQMEELKSTSKFFNLNKSIITMMMIMTMLMTMISVTKISSSLKGPLKFTYV